MSAAAFLPVLIILSGQLFPPIPVAESETIHLHVGKGGHWKLKIETSCHLRFADEVDAEEAFEGIRLAELEAFESEKGVWDCQVKVTGDKRGTIVLKGKGDDVMELLEMLQDVLGLERCSFTWDRSCLQIGGFPPKNEPSVFGAVVGAVASAILVGGPNPDFKGEIVITTDGRFIAEHLPGKIDDERRRLVLDLGIASASPEQERILRIEGLEE